MTYDTPKALRMALEQRLLVRSEATGISLDRLRRRVLFERITARLHAGEPGVWVVKGGMALEVRLRDDARLTKDLDLGLRGEVAEAGDLRERLIESLSVDAYGDRFAISVGQVRRLMDDDAGHTTWRAGVTASLAGTQFGGMQLDISPRAHELTATEVVPLPNSLEFAGIVTPDVEVVDVHRHVAEKFHGMLRDFGDRENTRVRDLVDLVILSEHGLVDAVRAATAVRTVWDERGTALSAVLGPVPSGWTHRYERLAGEHQLAAATLPDAVAVVETLWSEMFPSKES